jgi:hypothetical protein
VEAPFFPIIYLRGYAPTQGEVEDAAADPYMGFNVGSSKIRQLWDGTCQRHFFESPLVRLMKDFGYRDVYEGGEMMPTGTDVAPRSIFIHRYYERTSTELGDGTRLSIEQAASELAALIVQVRDRICGADAAARKSFRLYLVAHSMGGLVCRCLLQNQNLSATGGASVAEARAAVDKIFTYATPHNGIDLNVLGNIPGVWSRNDADNFNRDRMRQFLSLQGVGDGDVDSLDGKFDPDRFFNLVGTDDRDYDVAAGLVRKAVGPMSDGLVRIANATTWGAWQGDAKRNSPRAFVYRSHSGHYGIVNSEEGFQNLTRFLFGDVRVDGVLEIAQLSLPDKVQKAKDEGKAIRASYHFEVVVRVRGAVWDLHRRTVGENSAVFRKFDEMFPKDGSAPRHPQLFSTFLSSRARVNARRASLGFAVDLRVLVPQYEVDRKLWFDDHYEGGYLFRDKINLEAVPPSNGGGWTLRYGFDSSTPNRATRAADVQHAAGVTTFRIPVEQKTRPGMKATLVLRATQWNE